MGRPPKAGLDYFPVDTDIISDPKIQELIQEGETEAWTVYSWTLPLLYHEGYYIEKDSLIRSIGWTFRSLSKDRIIECLDLMARIGLIDKTMYEDGIITGKSFQSRYKEITKGRKNLTNMHFWMNKSEVRRVYSDGKPVYQWVNGVYDHVNPQSESERESESEKETKTNQSDVFVPSYSPTAALINKALESICYMDKDDYEWVAEAARFYPEDWLEEALELTLKGKKEGKVRAPVMYMSSILERWFHERAKKSADDEIDAREKELAEQKAEYMKPGKFTAKLGGKKE